jgi:hypothetical protein
VGRSNTTGDGTGVTWQQRHESSAAEEQVYRTTTVGQLVAALVECHDETDICHVFEHHQDGTLGFEIACQRLGISKADWEYANNVGGFYALVAIVAEKLGVPRYDPTAEKTRRETVTRLIETADERNEPMEKAAKETKLLLDSLTDELSRELPNRKVDVWISPFQDVTYVPAGEMVYLTFGINDVPNAVRALREVYKNEGLERGVASHMTAEQNLLAAGYVKTEVELRKDKLPVIGLVGKSELVLELTSNLERVGTRVSRLEGWKHTECGIQYRATRIPDEAGWLAQIVLPGSGQKRAGGMYYLLDEAEAKALRMAKIVEFCQLKNISLPPAGTLEPAPPGFDQYLRTGLNPSLEKEVTTTPEMNNNRTPYKFVGEKIITYYVDSGGYCLVAYDTVNKRASQPLARSDSREEIERMVASYEDVSMIVGKAATRKMREMLVPAAKHRPRAPRGPEIER